MIKSTRMEILGLLLPLERRGRKEATSLSSLSYEFVSNLSPVCVPQTGGPKGFTTHTWPLGKQRSESKRSLSLLHQAKKSTQLRRGDSGLKKERETGRLAQQDGSLKCKNSSSNFTKETVEDKKMSTTTAGECAQLKSVSPTATDLW